MTAQDILQAALALPEDDRVKLMDALASSLEGGADDAFVAMINERVARVEEGEPGIPGEAVFAELLSK